MEKKPASDHPRLFATTHWSVVLAVRDADPARSLAALENLCRAYWFPLYSFLRRHSYTPEDAEDLIQGFFEQLLQRQTLEKADQEKGRFRSFLLCCLKKYLLDQRERACRQKRGGGHATFSLDLPDAERRYNGALRAHETPEQHYERHWAATTVSTVLGQLREESTARGHGDLVRHLEGALMGEQPAETYADLARRTGLSEAAAKMAAHRLRQRYRVLFRDEIARTVHDPKDVDAEIAHLFQVLGG